VKTVDAKALIGCRYSKPLDSHFQLHPAEHGRLIFQGMFPILSAYEKKRLHGRISINRKAAGE
jgi:hypothetical protein